MNTQTKSSKARLRSAIKTKDGWWASIFSGPIANRLLEPICDIQWITPNHITIFSFMLGIIAAYCFSQGSHQYLIYGAILVQLSFIVDCMDGQLARYRQQFSNLGAWLDRISDRIKDFLYFFSLAWGFYHQHSEEFHYSLSWVNNLVHWFFQNDPDRFFTLPVWLQVVTLRSWTIPTWYIWVMAMIASFTIFLIDYYVNQDMKLEAGSRLPATDSKHKKPSAIGYGLSAIFNFGLWIYKSIPILRFNIGEQALLISLFTLLNSVFTLLLIFSLLGSIYIAYWPIAKYYGFSPEK